MSKRIYIEVKIADDDDTGATPVDCTLIETMHAVYSWEVDVVFAKLAEKVKKLTGCADLV